METIHLVTLPWLGLYRPITIGPFVFEPFTVDKGRVHQLSPQIIEHIQRIAACHVNVGGDRIDTFCLCHLRDGKLFTELTSPQKEQLRLAINILAFASIGHQTVEAIIEDTSYTQAPPSTERFDVRFFRTKVGDCRLAIAGGRINRSLEGGYTLKDIRFPTPLELGSSPSPNEEVLDGLSRGLFEGALTIERRNRIGRALEWFVRAHSESPSLSDALVIVMMNTAFECLLSPKKTDKSLFLADFFNEIRLNDDISEDRKIQRHKHPLREETKSKQSWVALDLYKLRNDIVHGEDITADKFVFTGGRRPFHKRVIATALFWEAVLHVLSEEGLVDGGAKEYVAACNFEDADRAIERQWRARSFSIDKLHLALGWR